MVRVFVVYTEEPDPDRYAQHVELCLKVPGAVFRHGKVTRTLVGDELAYYAEYEFPDVDAFKAAAATDAFKVTGADAADMGYPHSVYITEIA
jgi:hypothetical protein